MFLIYSQVFFLCTDNSLTSLEISISVLTYLSLFVDFSLFANRFYQFCLLDFLLSGFWYLSLYFPTDLLLFPDDFFSIQRLLSIYPLNTSSLFVGSVLRFDILCFFFISLLLFVYFVTFSICHFRFVNFSFPMHRYLSYYSWILYFCSHISLCLYISPILLSESLNLISYFWASDIFLNAFKLPSRLLFSNAPFCFAGFFVSIPRLPLFWLVLF